MRSQEDTKCMAEEIAREWLEEHNLPYK